MAEKIQDASLTAQVQLALVDAQDLRAFNIDPLVVNGHVLLRGQVETLVQRDRAEEVASGVAGIRSVVNELSSIEEPMIADVDEFDTTGVDSVSDAAPQEDPEDVAAADGEEEPEVSEPVAARQSESQETYHTVTSGDNLWDIARNYSVSVDQIRRLNNLGSNSIRPGQRLRVK